MILPLRQESSNGFTLMELAVALVIVGLVAGIILQSERATKPNNCYAETQAQLASVRKAIDEFVVKNGRLPLPAGRSYGVSSPNFGQEANGANDPAIHANGAGVLFGALPFQTLSLPASFAADCWGNKLSYVVTSALTSAGGYALPNAVGNIQIKTGTIASSVSVASNAAYAVISHGQDGSENGNCAVARNYQVTGNQGWRNPSPGPSSPVEMENCDTTNNDLYSAAFNNGKDAGTRYFDDVIIYGGRLNANCNEASYAVTWMDGSNGCRGTVAGPVNNGVTGKAIDRPNDGNATEGEASFACANGVIDITNPLGATCVQSVVQTCDASFYAWPTADGPCLSTTPSINEGASTTINTSTGGIGSITLQCVNGGLVATNPICTRPVNGPKCGSAHGKSFVDYPPSDQLCDPGSASMHALEADTGFWVPKMWQWDCADTMDAYPPVHCAAEVLYNAEEGTCGSAQGGMFASPPSHNLCLPGIPSIVSTTEEGGYTWTCSRTTICTASKAQINNVLCGPANGKVYKGSGPQEQAVKDGLCVAGAVKKSEVLKPMDGIATSYQWTCEKDGTLDSCDATLYLGKPSCLAAWQKWGDGCMAQFPDMYEGETATQTNSVSQYLGQLTVTCQDSQYVPADVESCYPFKIKSEYCGSEPFTCQLGGAIGTTVKQECKDAFGDGIGWYNYAWVCLDIDSPCESIYRGKGTTFNTRPTECKDNAWVVTPVDPGAIGGP